MPDSRRLAGHDAPAAREPSLGMRDADRVSETALALLTLDALRARVRELYETQRAVERERDTLRAAHDAVINKRRALLKRQNDSAAGAPTAQPRALAHDVNNMLGVIIGHVGIALRGVSQSDPLHHDLVAIQQAAERAAALIREPRSADAVIPAVLPPTTSTATTAPARVTPVSSATAVSEASVAPAAQRSVLLVEDEPGILTLVTHILRAQGFAVLRANSATEAIALAAAHAGRIDLLLTDVMMPEMNGRDLARALIATNPGLRTVFMSGYTADLIATHGVLDADVSFLQKPFSIDALTAVVHTALSRAH